MNKQQDNNVPIVMCFSGHDPSGGAGIQADIEAINANQAQPCTVITALTVQNTQEVQQVSASELAFFNAAANTLLNDVSVDVFKTGLLAEASIANAVARIAALYPATPLIVDPVLASGSGTSLSTDSLIQTLREKLLPISTIATPNLPEAKILSGEKTSDACAEKILAMGCQHVLLTGTHADTDDVINTLYSHNEKTEYKVKRLTGEFHGSGCTLASSLAANIANGHDIDKAVRLALDYTWLSLKKSRAIGKGQRHPHRHFNND